MIKKIKNFIMIVSLFFCVPSIVKAELPGARSASNSTGDVFLGGNYIEVGISKGGSFGTKASAPSEFHSHASSSVGLIADGDGWDVGNPPTTGDFFLPGTQEERIVLSYKIDGVTKDHVQADRMGVSWNSPIQALSVVDASDTENNLLKAIVTGITSDNVKLELIYSFDVNDKYYNTEVKVTNLGDKPITDVRFTRTFDPDQDANTKGVYATYNKIICSPDSSKEGGEDNYAMVVARGGNTLDGFFFVSFDNRARTARGHGFNVPSAYQEGLWVDTVSGLPTYSTTEDLAINPPDTLNGFILEDRAIAITTKLGDLAKDEVGETNYYSSLDPDVIASIANILKAVAAKVKNLSDTRIEVETKEGYEYSIDNGEHWQDSGVFEGLEPGKNYTILSRIKAVGETPASEPEETSVITKNAAKESPNTFELIVTEDEITIENVPGYEYSIDNGTTWQKSPIFTGLEPDTVYTIIARYEETYTEMPGNPTDPIIIRTPKKIVTALDTTPNANVDVVLEENSPALFVQKGLIYEAVMDDEDIKEAIENGDDVNIVFDVKSITIDEELTNKLNEEYPSKQIAFTVDATLKLFVNDSLVKNLNSSSKKITFTLKVPKEYQKSGRVFTIVRKHIGENDEVVYESFRDEDASDETITISSDKFSEFVILYEDGKNPKTGDKIIAYTVLLVISVLVLLFLLRKKKK